MSYQATVFQVFIASPGDVMEERAIIHDSIHRWNASHSRRCKAVLLPVGWDTHAYPDSGDRPQALLNKQLLCHCDLLVALFWSRFGTNTGKAGSGTVEEIEEHAQAGKPAMIYFLTKPIPQAQLDAGQLESIRAFQARIANHVLPYKCESSSILEKKFIDHLTQIVDQKLLSGISLDDRQDAGERRSNEISAKSMMLLKTAAESDGYIAMIQGLSKVTVQAGRQVLCETDERRVVAQWEHAIKELVESSLIEGRGRKGEVFVVTAKGFQVFDPNEKG